MTSLNTHTDYCKRCDTDIERPDDAETCPYCFRDICFDCWKKFGCCQDCQLKYDEEHED